jgi:phenylalanyl-tRNA synthetase beta chain
MKENFDYLRRKNDPPIAVEIGNPKTIGFEICRTSLLPGLFKTVQSSGKKVALPLKLFEVSDVVTLDAEAEVDGTRVGAVNTRMAAAVIVNTTDSFEVVHGLVDRLMQLFEVSRKDYTISEADDPTFLPRRSAQVVMKGVVLGSFGVVHPEVLQAFNFADKGPASAVELNVDMLLKLK